MNQYPEKNPLIVALTDFGLQDIYVGVIKGIISQINPHLNIIDLSHNLPRQNILAARFALLSAINYFPPSTIFLVVVDPTVGSKRKAIAVECEKGYLIGADNGIFDGVLQNYPPIQAIQLTNADFWLTPNPSKTFHGRDIFAPVAAHLARGISLDKLGKKINTETLVKTNLPNLEFKKDGLVGYIQYIDIYGNLITNIPEKLLENKSWFIQELDLKIEQKNTYSDVPINELVALIGSHGYLEIAVNGGSAAEKLQKTYLDSIQLIFYR